MQPNKSPQSSRRVEQGVLVITLTGPDLQDEKTASLLQGELAEAVQTENVYLVVLDLQNLRYISSVAFRPLLNLRRLVGEKQGRLALCNVSKVVGDILYTTRMVMAEGNTFAPFEIVGDLGEALAMLAGGPKG